MASPSVPVRKLEYQLHFSLISCLTDALLSSFLITILSHTQLNDPLFSFPPVFAEASPIM